MSQHKCHTPGCHKGCPPRWLMCRDCWAMVPKAVQTAVNSTVGKRGDRIDETWAPWWRAQADAIAAVVKRIRPGEAHKMDAYLKGAYEFADRLEGKTPPKDEAPAPPAPTDEKPTESTP